MSKPQSSARTGRRPEGDAEKERREHRNACQQCRRAGHTIGDMCPLGQHLTNKLGMRREVRDG